MLAALGSDDQKQPRMRYNNPFSTSDDKTLLTRFNTIIAAGLVLAGREQAEKTD